MEKWQKCSEKLPTGERMEWLDKLSWSMLKVSTVAQTWLLLVHSFEHLNCPCLFLGGHFKWFQSFLFSLHVFLLFRQYHAINATNTLIVILPPCRRRAHWSGKISRLSWPISINYWIAKRINWRKIVFIFNSISQQRTVSSWPPLVSLLQLAQQLVCGSSDFKLSYDFPCKARFPPQLPYPASNLWRVRVIALRLFSCSVHLTSWPLLNAHFS